MTKMAILMQILNQLLVPVLKEVLSDIIQQFISRPSTTVTVIEAPLGQDVIVPDAGDILDKYRWLLEV